jgi:hypothetical protein
VRGARAAGDGARAMNRIEALEAARAGLAVAEDLARFAGED